MARHGMAQQATTMFNPQLDSYLRYIATGNKQSNMLLACHSASPECACRRVGWDKDDVWFAHCCMLDDSETKQWAEDGVGIAHCPSSNMRLASGIAPVSL